MIRHSTIVYMVILAALAGAYYYLQNRAQPAEDAVVTPQTTEQATYLFNAESGLPISIRIESRSGGKVEIARDADNAWAVRLPVEAKAEQAGSETAASQVTTIRILSEVPDVSPEIVGLETPEHILTVRFGDGGERTIHIGVVTPTESGYYVQEAAGGKVFIISKSAVDALLGLLANPPYLETPTPNLTTTPGAIPDRTATPTP